MNETKQRIDAVLRDICDLPNRTSPEDQPDMMLVTGEELSAIIAEHFGQPSAALVVPALAEMRETVARALSTYRYGDDASWNAMLGHADAVLTAIGLSDGSRVVVPVALLTEGSPLINDLIWEVDRAIKQAAREGGHYDTVVRFVLRKHLSASEGPKNV